MAKIKKIEINGTSYDIGADYNNLENKPSINNVTLSGNKTTSDLGLYNKPSGGIPKTDLANTVQTSLEKADNALPASKMQVLTLSQYEALTTKDSDTYYHIIEE